MISVKNNLLKVGLLFHIVGNPEAARHVAPTGEDQQHDFRIATFEFQDLASHGLIPGVLGVKKAPLIRLAHSGMIAHHSNKIPVARLTGNEPGRNRRLLLGS